MCGALLLMPKEVLFRYNSFGKPALADHHESDLRFNVSHSHGLALLAVTREHGVGIDLEYLRPEIATQDVAKRFFSAAEVKSLERLPKEMLSDAFFKCWTRKEAYIAAALVVESSSLRLRCFQDLPIRRHVREVMIRV